MKYIIEFMGIGEAAHPSHFLQHIYRLTHIELTPLTTYQELFDKLEQKFANEPDVLEAVKDWVQFNKENITPEQLTSVVTKDSPYAIFDIIPNKD